MTTALAPSRALTAADRCDRCRARAFVRATLPSGGELLFCAHHARKYDDGLRRAAADIHDQSDRLADTPPSAPPGER